MHSSEGKRILVWENAFFCRKMRVSAGKPNAPTEIWAGGGELKITNGSLFSDDTCDFKVTNTNQFQISFRADGNDLELLYQISLGGIYSGQCSRGGLGGCAMRSSNSTPGKESLTRCRCSATYHYVRCFLMVPPCGFLFQRFVAAVP